MSRKWSKGEKAEVMAQRGRGLSLRSIGARFGATEHQIWGIVRRIERRQHSSMETKNEVAQKRLRYSGAPVVAPPEALADRDRRLNAEQTINMALLGDPVVPRWNSNASR